MGGVRRDFRHTFCLEACFILKNPHQTHNKGLKRRELLDAVFAFGGSFLIKNAAKKPSILRVHLVDFMGILSLVGVFKAKTFAGDCRQTSF